MHLAKLVEVEVPTPATEPRLQSDVVFGVRETLIVDMTDGGCDYDFVLDNPEGGTAPLFLFSDLKSRIIET